MVALPFATVVAHTLLVGLVLHVPVLHGPPTRQEKVADVARAAKLPKQVVKVHSNKEAHGILLFYGD